MKKRPDRFEKHIHETYDIGEMLQKEGKTNAERRAYQLITCTLLLICSHPVTSFLIYVKYFHM